MSPVKYGQGARRFSYQEKLSKRIMQHKNATNKTAAAQTLQNSRTVGMR